MINNYWPYLITGFLLAFAAAGHCIGMCGGLIQGLSIQTKRGVNWKKLWSYQFGRVTTYFLLTLLVSAAFFPLTSKYVLVARTIAAGFLIMLALHFLNIKFFTQTLEKVFLPLWKLISPLAQKLLRTTSLSKQYLAGMVWGLIPCGLLYSVIPYAVNLADLSATLFLMSGFAIGTCLTLWMSVMFTHTLRSWLSNQYLMKFNGIVLLIFAGYSLTNLYM
ncbi:MAG: sulfite exporter TauE/SafE family protein [Saccharospirillaceae bacterium]|nr:sulfite exporter TauE/SafE family protein [Pseudomonadales bacterium]NRB80739.1 sulfite exporter TauE/SafE family protein [Saccharospirillaceae bacterium]